MCQKTFESPLSHFNITFRFKPAREPKSNPSYEIHFHMSITRNIILHMRRMPKEEKKTVIYIISISRAHTHKKTAHVLRGLLNR